MKMKSYTLNEYIDLEHGRCRSKHGQVVITFESMPMEN
jgi:hypothetical protein